MRLVILAVTASMAFVAPDVLLYMFLRGKSDNLSEMQVRSSDLNITQRNFDSSKEADDSIAIDRSAASVLAEPAELLWRDFEIVFQNMRYNYSAITPETEEPAEGSSPDDCNVCDNFTRVFVFVPTRPDNFQQRANIRSSWANRNVTCAQNMVVRFVVGRTRNRLVLEMLFEELKAHNDLIINDIPDTYDNLFLKIFAAFQWQQEFCEDARYVLKADDDTVVNLDLLGYWIKHEFDALVALQPNTIFGYIWRSVKPIRDPKHKWNVPTSLFIGRTYPDFANGPTYLMTSAATAAIVRTAEYVKAFTVEDVLYTGVIASKAGIVRRRSELFFRYGNRLYRRERCSAQDVPYVISIYGMTAEQIPNVYAMLRDVKCRKSSRTQVSRTAMTRLRRRRV